MPQLIDARFCPSRYGVAVYSSSIIARSHLGSMFGHLNESPLCDEHARTEKIIISPGFRSGNQLCSMFDSPRSYV